MYKFTFDMLISIETRENTLLFSYKKLGKNLKTDRHTVDFDLLVLL